MIVNPNAVRRFRKLISNGIRNGRVPLRVVGNSKSGFSLAGERGKQLIVVASGFSRQRDAIETGIIKFKQTAKVSRVAA